MKAAALSPHSAAVIALERRYGLDPFPPMPDTRYWWPAWYVESCKERQRWKAEEEAAQGKMVQERML